MSMSMKHEPQGVRREVMILKWELVLCFNFIYFRYVGQTTRSPNMDPICLLTSQPQAQTLSHLRTQCP